jgi:hypothetical protein
MTELSDVWQGVLIIFIGTVGGLAIIFFGGLIWDNWWTGMDDMGNFDSSAVVDTSWHDGPGVALGFGNMFFSAGVFSVVLSWAAGLLTVYRRQRYDAYVRQY